MDITEMRWEDVDLVHLNLDRN